MFYLGIIAYKYTGSMQDILSHVYVNLILKEKSKL